MVTSGSTNRAHPAARDLTDDELLTTVQHARMLVEGSHISWCSKSVLERTDLFQVWNRKLRRLVWPAQPEPPPQAPDEREARRSNACTVQCGGTSVRAVAAADERRERVSDKEGAAAAWKDRGREEQGGNSLGFGPELNLGLISMKFKSFFEKKNRGRVADRRGARCGMARSYEQRPAVFKNSDPMWHWSPGHMRWLAWHCWFCMCWSAGRKSYCIPWTRNWGSILGRFGQKKKATYVMRIIFVWELW